MADVANLIADMVRSGVDADLIGRTAEALATRPAILLPDAAAEKRRAKDRERKNLRKSAEICATDEVSSLPRQESPQTPKETQPTLPTTHKENPPKGGQKKAARLPSDWVLPDEWALDAIEAGLPANHIDLEAAKMRDWSLSSRNGAKLDWRAVWRNWCREAAARLPQNRAPPSRPVDQLLDSLINRMEYADANARTEIEGHSQALGRLPSH